MKRIRVDFTIDEIKLLASLASDQLFRREFIDPKMPGYKADPAEVRIGKALVGRLRELSGELHLNTRSSPVVSVGVDDNSSKRTNGITDRIDRAIAQALTVASVCANAPATSGVYALIRLQEWLYVGQSNNIRASLLSHLQESGSALMKKKPTSFVFELCDAAGRCARQDRLVFEFEPVCNRMPLSR